MRYKKTKSSDTKNPFTTGPYITHANAKRKPIEKYCFVDKCMRQSYKINAFLLEGFFIRFAKVCVPTNLELCSNSISKYHWFYPWLFKFIPFGDFFDAELYAKAIEPHARLNIIFRLPIYVLIFKAR